MSWSIWEREMIRPSADVLIVGGGITGLASAWFLKQEDPSLDILVLDRSLEGTGASTRNAGFACMGSLGELAGDDRSMGEAASLELYAKRWEGLNLLRSIIPDEEMDLVWCGGYELFFKGQEEEWAHVRSILPEWNRRIRSATGIEQAFSVVDNEQWGDWAPSSEQIGAVRHHMEGRLHSGKMVRAWIERLRSEGVRLYSGVDVREIRESSEGVELRDQFDRNWSGARLLLATNAFTPRLMPGVDIHPARNQVLLTEELKENIPDACFHVHQGYIYFRRYGNRLLIGGARHLDLDGESTDRLGENERLVSFLQDFTATRLLDRVPEIAHQWSGIIGVGSEKTPLVRAISERQFLAARLSGMGVALGSAIGRQAARLILDNSHE